MDRKQTNEFNSYTNGNQAMDDEAAQYAGNQPLIDVKAAMLAGLGDIETHKQAQTMQTTGASVIKVQTFFKMGELGLPIARLIVAYANSIDDADLAGEVDFEKSDLIFVDMTVGRSRAGTIADRATINQPAMLLAGYQLTAQMVTDYKAAIIAFDGAEGGPVAAKAKKVAATKNLKIDFKEMRKKKKTLFDLMKPYINTDLTFYNTILDAYVIMDGGTRKVAARIYVLDETVMVRLPNAKVRIVELDIAKPSSARGIADFSQQQLPNGNYTIEVFADGYLPTKIANVKVEHGIMSKVEVLMKKDK